MNDLENRYLKGRKSENVPRGTSGSIKKWAIVLLLTTSSVFAFPRSAGWFTSVMAVLDPMLDAAVNWEWAFPNQLDDSSTNSFTATEQNTPIYAYMGGGNASNFNTLASGDSDALNNTSFTAINGYDITISAWARSTSTGGCVVSIADASVTDQVIAMRIETNGNLILSVDNAGEVALTNSAVDLNDNVWHYLSGVLTATDMKLYIDSTLVTTRTHSVTFPTGIDSVGAGRIEGSSPNTFFGGDIGAVSVVPSELSQSSIEMVMDDSRLNYGWVQEFVDDPNASDLVIWYPFNYDGAGDIGTNENHGIFSGPAWRYTKTTNTTGRLLLDGVNDSAISSKNLDITGSSASTVSFWIRPGATASTEPLIFWGVDAAGTLFQLNLTSAGDILFTSGGPGTAVWGQGDAIQNWTHVALVHTNGADSGGGRLYLDGIDIGFPDSIVSAVTLNTTATALEIGTGAGGGFYGGLMDDVRIYRTALSSNNIFTIFTNTVVTHIGDESKKTFYDMEDSQDIAKDRTVFSADGTPTDVTFAPPLGSDSGHGIFNGTSSKISIAGPFPGAFTNISWSLWFKSDVQTPSANERLFTWNEDGFITLMFQEPDGDISMRLGNITDPLTTITNVTMTDWHNIVVTMSDGVEAKVFIDGTNVVTTNISAFAEIVTTGRFLGSTRSGNADFYAGREDEFEFFEKILTSTEVTNLFNKGH